jgi:hypothetical protein
MFLPLPALVVAVPLLVADQVPTFNVNPTCGGNGRSGRGSDVCTKSEMAARDELAKQWTGFQAADRARCVQLATMSRMPSYVQVITCLEMAREARQLETGQRSTTGAASPGDAMR